MDNIFDIKFTFEKKVRDEVIYKFSNKQGGAYNIFSYHWQCFVWATTIGFLRNEPRELKSPLSDKVFSLNTMKNNGGEKDAQALICLAIARYGSLDIMKDPAKAIDLINKYANGGFYHIMKLMESGEVSFNDVEQVKQEIFSRDYDDIEIETMPQPIEQDEPESFDDDVEDFVEEDDNIINEEELRAEAEKPWEEHDIDRLKLYFENDMEVPRIAERLGKSIYSVKFQLAQLGFIRMPLNVTVRNTDNGGSVINQSGEVIYTDEAPFKVINDRIFRFKLQRACLTVKEIKRDGGEWVKSGKMLVAHTDSDLYPELSVSNFIDDIEDFTEGESREQNKIKVKGIWYDYYGDLLSAKPQLTREEVKKPVYTEASAPSRKRWSAAERRVLQSYYETGMSIDKLASFFNTTEDNVIEVLRKLKIFR